MDPSAVIEAIAELAPMVQADGADLTLVEANPATGKIEVALHVPSASCAECVLPGPLLKQVISDAISRRMPTPFDLVLHDPRSGAPTGRLLPE